jgi:hypothetical protein
MNFILKNLGWILLFLFFVFMLFVISTKQKKDVDNQILSGSISTQSGEENKADIEELEKLVEKIEKEEKIVSQETIIEKTIEKKSIFDIFKRKKRDQNYIEDRNALKDEKSSTWEIMIQKEENINTIKTQEKKTVDFITQEDTMNNGMDLVKNTGTSVALKKSHPSGSIYREDIISASKQFPWLYLVTAPGKEFQVWVHSLKLNNKWFNKKLWFIMKGDTIKQLGFENVKWCFEVEVLQSTIESSIWKKAYVCKKYLSDISVDQKIEENEISTNIENIDASYTINKQYFKANTPTSLKTKSLQDTDLRVAISDVLLQISSLDNNGCFSVRVVGSNIDAQYGKQGYICKNEVSSYSIVQ